MMSTIDPRLAELAERIRAIRESRGMTQRDVAAGSGCTQPAVSLLESGRTAPRITTLWKIADALDLDLDELLR
jgi:transcriptional regulator with XRE-family HTH domain